MSDDDLTSEDSEYLKKQADYYTAVRGVVKNLLSIEKEFGMGTEYLHSLLSGLGVVDDAQKLRDASWHSMCEWDL